MTLPIPIVFPSANLNNPVPSSSPPSPQCMAAYVALKIREGDYTIECPDVNCDCSGELTLEEVESLVGSELFQLHLKFRKNTGKKRGGGREGVGGIYTGHLHCWSYLLSIYIHLMGINYSFSPHLQKWTRTR